MARVLVAGASGLLGSRVLGALAGHDLLGTTRKPERLAQIEATGARGLLMDALDPASVDAAMREARPDIVIHELTDLSGCDYAANARLRVEGTANLVAAALATGATRMVAQSISWAYAPAETPAAESDPLDEAQTAVAALEREVARMPVGVVLRYGLLYGPGTWYARDGAQAEAARTGTLQASTARTSFVHLDDAVAATVQALDWPAGPVNVVDDEPTTIDEWGPLYAHAMGFTGTPDLTTRGPGRAASNTLARTRGWTPTHPTWRTSLLA